MKITNVITKFSIQLLAVAGLLILSTSAYAAIDMFLHIEGIDGESQDRDHARWIDVLAFSEGMSSPATTHVGGGGGTARVNVSDLSVTKYLDSSSPFIRQQLASGKHIPTATLVVRKAGPDPLIFFKIELFDVILTSVSMGGSGGEDRMTENITINFSKIKWTYTPQKADGSGGAAIPATWDIVTNTPF